MLETRKKILCIEDDREAASLIAEDLADRGFDVSVAHDGQAGFSAILRDQPDLVVCDVNLPFMSGFELAERLSAAAPSLSGIPFVFLTALSDCESEARRRGSYVAKPIDFDKLETIIDAQLAEGVARGP